MVWSSGKRGVVSRWCGSKSGKSLRALGSEFGPHVSASTTLQFFPFHQAPEPHFAERAIGTAEYYPLSPVVYHRQIALRSLHWAIGMHGVLYDQYVNEDSEIEPNGPNR